MLAQVDNSTLIMGLVGLILTANGSTIILVWRYISKMKDKVQYKDVCFEIVKRIEEKGDERHQAVKEDLEEIKDLIRNNGKSPLRVQT